MLLYRSGLFRPLRFPAYKGTPVCLGVSFEMEDQEKEYLVSALVMRKASAWFLVVAQSGEWSLHLE